jgi:hypothetical protein
MGLPFCSFRPCFPKTELRPLAAIVDFEIGNNGESA